MGGKTRTGADGKAAQGWDHDPPAQRKWTPLGILVIAMASTLAGNFTLIGSVANLIVAERARRLVECGKHAIIFLDSITRMARAYNHMQKGGGKILSGGIENAEDQRGEQRAFEAAQPADRDDEQKEHQIDQREAWAQANELHRQPAAKRS